MSITLKLTVAALALAFTGSAMAQDFQALEGPQSAANNKAGPRSLPARIIPLPAETDSSTATLAAAPYRAPAWNANPANADE